MTLQSSPWFYLSTMNDESINIEQLQSEIDRAESYLNQVTHSRISGTPTYFHVVTLNNRLSFADWNRSPTSNLGSRVQPRQRSQVADSVGENSANSSYSTTSSTNRYADPVEREKLLQRLLAEHGARSRQHSNTSTPRSNQFTPEGDTYERESSVYDSAHSRMGPSNGQDTLFFASEYLDMSTPQSGGPSGGYFYDHTVGSTLSMDSISPEELLNHHHSYDTQYATESKSPPRTLPHRPGRSVSPDMYGTVDRRERQPSDVRTAMRGSSRSGRGGAEVTSPGPVSTTRKHLKSKQEILEEAKAEFRKQHPFKPQVVTKPQRAVSAPRGAVSSTDRIDAMLKAHEHSLAQREQQRVALQRSEVASNCTFRPKLSKGTQHILQQKAQDEGRVGGSSGERVEVGEGVDQPASERLYAQAEKRKIQQREMQRKVELARRHEYTYQPAINPATNSMIQAMEKEYLPIYARVGALVREQTENKQILLECYEQAQSEMTFQPEICERSRKLAERRQRGRGDSAEEEYSKDVGTRLLQAAHGQMERKFKLVEDREREMSEQFSDPKPCKGSDDIIRRNAHLRYSMLCRDCCKVCHTNGYI